MLLCLIPDNFTHQGNSVATPTRIYICFAVSPLGFPNMANIGIGGVNPMASLGASAGSLGTMGTMQSAMTGVSTADPLAQTYSSMAPYTGIHVIVIVLPCS